MIHFRKAVEADAPRITAIYANARLFMAASGNPNQWIDGYPSEADVRADISADVLWTACRGDEILAVFALIEGPDPTYAVILGAGLNDRPYAVVHRLASSGKVGGIGEICLRWCLDRFDTLRVDTHADNRVMQRTLIRMGFVYTGIIFCHNGTPRLAYQLDRR